MSARSDKAVGGYYQVLWASAVAVASRLLSGGALSEVMHGGAISILVLKLNIILLPPPLNLSARHLSSLIKYMGALLVSQHCT